MHLVSSHKCVDVHFTLGLGNGSVDRGTTYRIDNLNSIPVTHMNSGKSTFTELSSDFFHTWTCVL